MKKITGFIIDPKAQTITRCNVSEEKINELIGCAWTEKVPLGSPSPSPQEELLLVDEEGIYKEERGAFSIGRFVFHGKGLVLGNFRGKFVETMLEREDLTTNVKWMSLEAAEADRKQKLNTPFTISY